MRADKDEIRARSDIVEIIGTYVSLKQKGRNWQGLCPFHQEKTPSFYVDPSTQTFKCFGCGASGDIFTFISRYENMSFVEAAEWLARRAGLEFARRGQEEEAAKKSARDLIYEINAVARDFFRKMLERVPAAREYVQQRGLTHEALTRFQIGYAPDSWDALLSFLTARRYSLQIAETAGLVVRASSGDLIDMFRHRIIFPIHDEQERVVGFGGRALGDVQPKYLNTGETPVFAKSRLLYGLPFARRKIAAEGRLLLMEGYMDVVAAHQADFSNALATLGTSLTEEHARKLARLAPVVTLVYDADNAGIKATLRASELLEKEGVQVRVVRLPPGDDPDSLLRRGDSAAFQRAIDSAVGRVEYQLERIVSEADQTTEAGRARMLRQIVAILASVPVRVERDAYIEKVWRFHPMSGRGPGIAKEMFHRDAEAYNARRRGDAPATAQEPSPPPPLPPPGVGYRGGSDAESGYRRRDSGEPRRERYRRAEWRERPRPMEPPPVAEVAMTQEERAERELIRALASPLWRAVTLKYASADDFLTPLARRFFLFVQARAQKLQSEEANLVEMLIREEEEDFSTAVRQQLQEFNTLMANVPITEALIQGCVETLRKHRKHARLAELAQSLQSKTTLTEEDQERLREYDRLLKEVKRPPSPPS